jgi:hypothetical protein
VKAAALVPLAVVAVFMKSLQLLLDSGFCH